jgi:TonB family protein
MRMNRLVVLVLALTQGLVRAEEPPAGESAPSASVPAASSCEGVNGRDCLDRALKLLKPTDGSTPDPRRAVPLLEIACALGEQRGCTRLAVALYGGNGVTRDVVRAARLIEQACDAREPEACGLLGMRRLDGPKGPKSEAWAAVYLKRACDGGVRDACGRLQMLGSRHEAEAAGIEADLSSLCRPADGQECTFDHPPKAKKITRPEYPRAAFDAGIEGKVLLQIIIGSDGQVLRVEVLQSVPGLDAAAIECVHKWRFEPAVRDGRPVAALAHAPVDFRIFDRRR